MTSNLNKQKIFIKKIDKKWNISSYIDISIMVLNVCGIGIDDSGGVGGGHGGGESGGGLVVCDGKGFFVCFFMVPFSI